MKMEDSTPVICLQLSKDFTVTVNVGRVDNFIIISQSAQSIMRLTKSAIFKEGEKVIIAKAVVTFLPSFVQIIIVWMNQLFCPVKMQVNCHYSLISP